jgi:hypothetical protein
MGRTNRQILIEQLPQGKLALENFRLRETAARPAAAWRRSQKAAPRHLRSGIWSSQIPDGRTMPYCPPVR